MTYVTPHIGPARYVAVDLETTGLGEDAHLLEISVLILDAQLRERASYTTLVHHPAGALNGLDEKVREMHAAFRAPRRPRRCDRPPDRRRGRARPARPAR